MIFQSKKLFYETRCEGECVLSGVKGRWLSQVFYTTSSVYHCSPPITKGCLIVPLLSLEE